MCVCACVLSSCVKEEFSESNCNTIVVSYENSSYLYLYKENKYKNINFLLNELRKKEFIKINFLCKMGLEDKNNIIKLVTAKTETDIVEIFETTNRTKIPHNINSKDLLLW